MTSDIQALANQARALSASNVTSSGAATKVVNLRPAERQEIAAPTGERTTVTNAVSEPPQEEQPEQSLLETVNALNENHFNVKRSLRFEVDEQTGVTVITVKDSQTDEVIRQIPSEELLKLAQHIQSITEEFNEAKGMFLSTEA
ncbi:flagellar protein FlaG [Permianibacter aggregans]|uniref:Flagellar protein FlaG n=1 Tax=Permianibacter aggregans TaxID=1510150 RepID=A0A4R6UNA2_9GAMM|nr:flagellar protein FlaG [Permianibacter aggregans]QGX38290.1 flagellar protein FlaG [Permianibacter aggregans]TDQ48608.1 flagellar protein FlaG [Permianibacter aggregans]